GGEGADGGGGESAGEEGAGGGGGGESAGSSLRTKSTAVWALVGSLGVAGLLAMA
ncbi:hypothetical protein V493_02207, partial [Pseudogymnoascus sp. VKM F-4281 (FW-2241)]